MADKKKQTETVEISVRGLTVQVGVPYAEGHTLSATEANVLNQTYRENVRNNLSALAKKVESGELSSDDWASQSAEYASTYTFGQVSAGGRTLDPVTKEARVIAKRSVEKALRDNPGRTEGMSPDEKKAFKAEKIAEASRDERVIEAAKKVVASRGDEIDIAV